MKSRLFTANLFNNLQEDRFLSNFTLKGGWNEFYESLIESIKDFFNPTLSGYTNFNFGSDNIINIHVIVFGIFIGVMAASVYAIYTKQILGKFVRALLVEEATTPESAKTIGELGFSKNYAVIHGLKGYTLGRVVSCIEKDEYIENTNRLRANYEENRKESSKHGKRLPPFREPKFDKKVSECRYYISENKKYTAQMRFNPNGSGYGTFFFVLLVSVMCIIIIYALLPQILAFADAALSDFTVKGNTRPPIGN